MSRTLEPVPNGKDGVDIRVTYGNRSEQWHFELIDERPHLSAYFLHEVDKDDIVVKTLKHYQAFYSLTSFHLTSEGSRHLSRRPPIPEDVLSAATKWLWGHRAAILEKALARAHKFVALETEG